MVQGGVERPVLSATCSGPMLRREINYLTVLLAVPSTVKHETLALDIIFHLQLTPCKGTNILKKYTTSYL